jgi:hypothetical protein
MPVPIWLEVKYINLISHRLVLFKKVGDFTYTFRCPYCGDSKKNQFKSRGYVYSYGGHLGFKCHNCGVTKSISNFIKDTDHSAYEDMRLEILSELGTQRKQRSEILLPKFSVDLKNKNIFDNIKCVLEYSEDSIIRKYLDGRKIPIENQKDMYFVTRFMEWINTIIPDKFLKSQLKMDEPRIVIPFYTKEKNIFAITGRSFRSKSIKYITIKFDDNQNKIFGLDKLNPEERVYIVEGPIDSFFLDNSIAFAGSSGNIPAFKDSVIVLDNEPRNKEIVKLIGKFIAQGRNVCIWPSYIRTKDINDLSINGYSKQDIKKIIDDNTFNGLKAKIKFDEWKVIQ